MTHYGFNFLWMFIWEPGQAPQPPALNELDFVAKQGFNFVRLPTDYRYWTEDFDYLAFHPEHGIFEHIDGYVSACVERGLHVSLNSHRTPGYCINRNDLERHNLWLDREAQDGFVHLWETFARRYKGTPNAHLSFDLLNEPPGVGDYGMTREIHAALMRRTAAAIHAIDPQRPLVINGIGAGHIAMPELADFPGTHSGRGYQPMPVSHHGASWVEHIGPMPDPVYPGVHWDGVTWNRESLQAFYEPWRAVERLGVQIHIGEFGCFNRTPNDVALNWLRDLVGIWKEFGWGYALWSFKGAFGVVDHGRPGARWEMIDGLKVDRELLEILRPGSQV